MIQAIWIITDTGQCIFSHKYIELDIDDQLIAGLLTAFDAFSSESGIGGVQQIGGEDNQFIYGSSQKLLVAALADKRDNADLVEKLMVKISDLFQEKYAPYLKDLAFVDLNVFNGFEDEIDQILKPKVYNRGAGSTIFGTIVSLALTAGIVLLLWNILFDAVFLVFLALIPGLFIGGLIAGKNTYGLIATSITILPIIGVYAYFIIDLGDSADLLNTVFNIILMAVTYITIAMLCGIGGGSIIDRRRLFPLVEETEQLAVLPSQVTVAQPDLRTQLAQQQETYQQETYPQETYQEEQVQEEERYYDSSSIVEEKKDEWGN